MLLEGLAPLAKLEQCEVIRLRPPYLEGEGLMFALLLGRPGDRRAGSALHRIFRASARWKTDSKR